MLDHLKLIAKLTPLHNEFNQSIQTELTLAQNTWQKISCDQQFQTTVNNQPAPWPLPIWPAQKLLIEKTIYANCPINYTIIATDGSQIYPDRHMGSNFFLLNTGLVQIGYGTESWIQLSSEPEIFTDHSAQEAGNLNDLIDCKRQEFELAAGLQAAHKLLAKNIVPLFLFDGALIFWGLETKPEKLKRHYYSKYLASLQALTKLQIPYAGYISLPNSKDLVNLLRWKLLNSEPSPVNHKPILQHVNDVHVAQFFLAPLTYSLIFQSGHAIVNDYPGALRPQFTYLQTGAEVARIELPNWLAQDSAKCQKILAIIIDQVQKGQGYPICLAEAHAQAVVSTPDRELFYHLLGQQTAGGQLIRSRKLQRKKTLGI